MNQFEVLPPRRESNSKRLWKQSALVDLNQRVFVNAGRQQQAGKKEYLSGWSFGSDKALEEIMHQFVACGKSAILCQFAVRIQESDETCFGTTNDVVVLFFDHIVADWDQTNSWFWSPTPKPRLEYGFLSRAQRLESSGNVDAALDIIYDYVDKQLKTQRFYDIDQILTNVKVIEQSADILLALLTATLPARSKLSERAKFFSEVEEALKQRGEWENDLLVGLEN